MKQYTIPLKVKTPIILPKDRPDPHKIPPPYIANTKEYEKVLMGIMVLNSLVYFLVENSYPTQRKQMLAHFKKKLKELKDEIEVFLETYKEVETL